jgi:GNAT superfamily N-acetyltransferase
LKFFFDVIKRFTRLTISEVYSLEKYFIYLYEASKLLKKEKNNNDSIRTIRREDKFVNDHLKSLSDTFLARGEIGFGYYLNDIIVGFLWIRFGECHEQLGRDTIIIPQDYALLHHLTVDPEFQGKGIGKTLLREYTFISTSLNIVKTLAFVSSGDVHSIIAFTSVNFVQQGAFSSERCLGKRIVNINSSGIPLHKGPISEYRSSIIQSINFPVKILSEPYLSEKETLTSGVIGGRPWLSILTASALRDSVPGIIHAVSTVGTPVLIPCSVKVGKRIGQIKINIEPTFFQPWPVTNEHTNREIVSAVAKIGLSRWVESLNWPLPFWVSKDLQDMKLPDGCRIEKRDDPSWVVDVDDSFEKMEKKYSKTACNYIRQAEKRGVVVCDAPTKEDLNDFAVLWSLSYKERGWSGLQYDSLFFFAVSKYITDGVSIVLAKVNEKVVSGGVFVRDALGYVYLLGAVDRDYNNYRPMYAIISHILKKAAKLQLKYINLGGTGGLDSLVSFKQHWGAQPRELYWLRCAAITPNISEPRKFFDKAYERLFRYHIRSIGYKFRNSLSRSV